MANTMSIDQIKDLAAKYMDDPKTKGLDELREWIQKQGKKVYPAAVENPVILVFMADNALVRVEDIDKYLVDVSWSEWPNVIKRLLQYKSNPPESEKKQWQKKRLN